MPDGLGGSLLRVGRPPSRGFCLVGNYGIMLRGMDWHYERALPFEVFTAHHLVPPPEEPAFRRSRHRL